MKYLQFASITELLDHLEAHHHNESEDGARAVHLDLSEKHAPSGHGFSLINIYAIVSQDCGEYLAVYGTLINQIEDIHIRANDAHAKAERQKFNAQIEERLGQVREEIAARSFLIRRGVWTGEAPTYLRRAL